MSHAARLRADAPAWERRRALLSVLGVVLGFRAGRSAAAADLDPFALVETVFAARLAGPEAIAVALSAGPLHPVPNSNPYFDQFTADLPSGMPFTQLDLRYARARPAGIAVLSARPGLPVAPENVRARHGASDWHETRPENPVSYLRYLRPGGRVSFGFPRAAGLLDSVVVAWGVE